MGPTIAIIGATGYVGKFLTSEFLHALKDGRVHELRVLTTKPKDFFDNTLRGFETRGAKAFCVNFASVDSLVSAFTGVDIVVSTLGTGAGSKESKATILQALSAAGIKIYFPSEFGTNHYTRCKNYQHEIFEMKKEHFKAAKAKGIKTIAVLPALILEGSFGKWFGLDTKEDVWTLVGDGDGNVPVAMTAEKDLGRFTVEAALKAFENPIDFPEILEVFSCIKSMKEYAEIFDKIAGKNTTFVYTSLEEALKAYKTKDGQFEYMIQILMGEGGFNCGDANGNRLLNPNESLWKLKTIEDYAAETNGRPWNDFE